LSKNKLASFALAIALSSPEKIADPVMCTVPIAVVIVGSEVYAHAKLDCCTHICRMPALDPMLLFALYRSRWLNVDDGEQTVNSAWIGE
jgi:hypothetical protein